MDLYSYLSPTLKFKLDSHSQISTHHQSKLGRLFEGSLICQLNFFEADFWLIYRKSLYLLQSVLVKMVSHLNSIFKSNMFGSDDNLELSTTVKF